MWAFHYLSSSGQSVWCSIIVFLGSPLGCQVYPPSTMMLCTVNPLYQSRPSSLGEMRGLGTRFYQIINHHVAYYTIKEAVETKAMSKKAFRILVSRFLTTSMPRGPSSKKVTKRLKTGPANQKELLLFLVNWRRKVVSLALLFHPVAQSSARVKFSHR
ncbi:hypothetical protein J6590_052328 [Homalodisca vitripennis]|nr:hypothetical protein J6590_052328 [Homalodisca vitripennis]